MEFLKDFIKPFAESGFLAILTALIGWFFVYKNSRSLQKRSETWSIVKNISDNLKEIESLSRKFWIPNDNKFLNAISYQNEITALLGETERWIGHLNKRLKTKEDIFNSHITDIFRDATNDIEKIKDQSLGQRRRATVLVARRIRIVKGLVDSSYESHFL